MILRVMLAVVSTACLVALAVYFIQAYRNNSPTLYLIGRVSRLSFMQKLFPALAGLGLLTCVWNGTEAMLFWIPSSWWIEGSDGDGMPMRSYLAGFMMIPALFWIQFLSTASFNSMSLEVLKKQERGLRQIVLAKDFELTALKESLAKEATLQAGSNEWSNTPLPAHEQIQTYRLLIAVIDKLQRRGP